jgi:hypothetical protein
MDRRVRVIAVLLCGMWVMGIGTLAAQTPGAAPQPVGSAGCGVDFVKSLAGVWKAAQYKIKRGSDVGAQLFGPNSYDVRDVELSLDPSGAGVLKIATSVLDQKGKTWAPTTIEANVTIAPSDSSAAGRCEPAVVVAQAQERYLDETKYEAPVAGARVSMIIDPATKQLDLRFDPPKGQGAFWTTLRRQAVR